MPGLGKKLNSYATELGNLYDKMPKAVFAAIAVSGMTQGGDYLEKARANVLEEWRILYDQGIVPQKPPTTKEA